MLISSGSSKKAEIKYQYYVPFSRPFLAKFQQWKNSKTPHRYRVTVVVNTVTRHAQTYQKHSQSKSLTKPRVIPRGVSIDKVLIMSVKLETEPSRSYILTKENRQRAIVSLIKCRRLKFKTAELELVFQNHEFSIVCN